MYRATYQIEYKKGYRIGLSVVLIVYSLPGMSEIEEKNGGRELNVKTCMLHPDELPAVINRKTRGGVILTLMKME